MSNKLPRNEKIKIGPDAVRVFKSFVSVAADSVSQIRSGYDGVGRLMECAEMRGGPNARIAFREWLLRQKDLPAGAREILLSL